MKQESHWPDDADGDVFRRLSDDGFDFNQECVVDFSIDFTHWPRQMDDLCESIRSLWSQATITPVGNDSLLVQIKARLDYSFVVSVQKQLTDLARAHGGACESWGLLHRRPSP